MRRRRPDSPLSLFSFQDIITGLCGIMIFVVLVQVLGLAVGRRIAAAETEREIDIRDMRSELKAEIVKLERDLAAVKSKSDKAVVAVKDKVKPEEVEKTKKELTEKELVVAALVSQVHDLKTQVEKARNADAENEAKVREMERAKRMLEQQMFDMKKRHGVTLIPERGETKIPVYMMCSWAGLEIHSPFEQKPRMRIEPVDFEHTLNDFLAELDHTTHCVVLLVRPSGVEIMNKAVELLKAGSFTYGRDPLEENAEVRFDTVEGK